MTAPDMILDDERGAGVGARVALIEKHLLGGDCLNYGCVPSKGLIRSARAVSDVREAPEFGVRVSAPEPDFGAAMARMRRLRARISRNDSAEWLREHGVDVFLGTARFVAEDAVEVGGARLRFKRAIVATGGRAAALPVPGLAEARFLTNETVLRRALHGGSGPDHPPVPDPGRSMEARRRRLEPDRLTPRAKRTLQRIVRWRLRWSPRPGQSPRPHCRPRPRAPPA